MRETQEPYCYICGERHSRSLLCRRPPISRPVVHIFSEDKKKEDVPKIVPRQYKTNDNPAPFLGEIKKMSNHLWTMEMAGKPGIGRLVSVIPEGRVELMRVQGREYVTITPSAAGTSGTTAANAWLHMYDIEPLPTTKATLDPADPDYWLKQDVQATGVAWYTTRPAIGMKAVGGRAKFRSAVVPTKISDSDQSVSLDYKIQEMSVSALYYDEWTIYSDIDLPAGAVPWEYDTVTPSGSVTYTCSDGFTETRDAVVVQGGTGGSPYYRAGVPVAITRTMSPGDLSAWIEIQTNIGSIACTGLAFIYHEDTDTYDFFYSWTETPFAIYTVAGFFRGV